MLRIAKSTAALVAALCAIAGLAACGGSSHGGSSGGLSAGSVASVAGAPITLATFDHWMGVVIAAANAANNTPAAPVVVPDPPTYARCVAHLRATQPTPAKGTSALSTATLRASCQDAYTNFRNQALSFLIFADWIVGEAGRQKISVTDASIESEFKSDKHTQFPKAAEYRTYLAQSHQTQADLLLQIKVRDLSTQLRNRAVEGATNVSAAAIASYFNAHRQSYATPAVRNLSVILLRTRAGALAAKSAVESGTPFATEARKVSIDTVTRARGGLETGVAKGEEQPALDAAVFSAPLNTLEGPVEAPYGYGSGYYIFEVHSGTPGAPKTLAQVSSTVKSQLVTANEQTALNKWLAGFTARWTAQTDCSAGYVIMDCKQYKKPKSAAGGATGASG